jgi:hypothetical protein
MDERKGPFLSTKGDWPKLRETAIAKYYLARGYKLHKSAHEGMCFSANVVRNILAFFQKHPRIRDNTFNYKYFLEEFALQTIATNEVGPDLEYGFLKLGHGVSDNYDPHAANKYTRKIPFLE